MDHLEDVGAEQLQIESLLSYEPLDERWIENIASLCIQTDYIFPSFGLRIYVQASADQELEHVGGRVRICKGEMEDSPAIRVHA